MAISNIRRFAQAMSEEGNYHLSFFHKTSGPTPAANTWCDVSMGAGIPKYNAYVGSQNTATPLIGSGNDGIYLGANPESGKHRYINLISMQTTTISLNPGVILFMDYLLHYPLTDGDNTDQQDMDNTQTLPRYTDGEGVMCMAVCTTPMSANATVTINYTNSDGVSGRSSVSSLIATSNVGGIISSSNTSASSNSRSPFIPLANGDRGIRSIESATMSTGSGGFFALVLVKPLTTVSILETAVASETSFINQKAGSPIKLYDGCYLNFAALTVGSTVLHPLRGLIEIAIQ